MHPRITLPSSNRLISSSSSALKRYSTKSTTQSKSNSVIAPTHRTHFNLRPATRSIAFIAASSIAGGLSLALYNSNPSFSVRNAFAGSHLNILGNSFSTSSTAKMADYPVNKSDEDWRLQLSPEQFRILRKKGTEMAGTGEYDKHYPTKGVYNCAGCDAPLYNYDSKFKSGCGWPAFFEEIPGSVKRFTDSTFGMKRTEIVCANCGGHLGHVFKGEGFGHPKDERHCVNSVSLKYSPAESAKAEGE